MTDLSVHILFFAPSMVCATLSLILLVDKTVCCFLFLFFCLVFQWRKQINSCRCSLQKSQPAVVVAVVISSPTPPKGEKKRFCHCLGPSDPQVLVSSTQSISFPSAFRQARRLLKKSTIEPGMAESTSERGSIPRMSG